MKAFKKHPSIQINEKIQLDLYQSRNSKLRIAVSNVPGPMVHCYLNFVTETNNDDGLAHCLEHLVFMGCEKYKGNLDEITNRCLSETQGVTEQTNTYYEFFTVGTMGFLKSLPAYIHYLLAPTLTQSQFITEVHHIDGEGYDSGVIYNEQADASDFMDDQRKKLFYPKYSGYAYDHGGSQKNLRETCSLKNIRQYHKKFYHLDNLFIIVCGIINLNQLLETITKIECEYIEKIPKNFERPFQKELAEFKLEPNKAEIIVPSDFDDEYGKVEISWKGPQLSNFYQWKALLILIDYLNDASSKKRKMGIFRTEEELLYEFNMEQSHYEIIARFGNVRIEKMDTNFKENFLSKIRMEHKKIDVEKICQIIEQHKHNYFCELEKNAHILIKDGIVDYQLYGTNEEQLEERLNEMKMLNSLKNEGSEFWCKLFHETFNERCFCLFAKPTKKEYEKLEKKEKQRINERLKTLDLKAKKDELEAAIKENERNKLGDDLLKELILDEIEQFSLFRVETIKNGMDLVAPNLLPNLPFHYFHKMESEVFELMNSRYCIFFYFWVTIIFDTQSFSNEERNFLLLWAELIFQSPANLDVLSSEEVEKMANCGFISKKFSIGIADYYDRFIFFKLSAKNQNFKNLASWAKFYMQESEFNDATLIKCSWDLVNKARNENDDEAIFLSDILTYNKNSNKFLCNSLAQQKFHNEISLQFRFIGESAAKFRAFVLKILNEIRKKLLSSIVNIHFISDLAKLDENDWLEQNWNFLSNQSQKMKFEYQPEDQNWEMMGKICAIETENSKCLFVQKGKFEGTWRDAILPEGNTMETLILAKYLCYEGGPVYNAIRCDGSAYKTPFISVLPDQKTIDLCLEGNNFDQFFSIYEKTKKVAMDILSSGELDKAQFESAKQSLIYDLVSKESTMEQAAESAILATIRNVGPNFTQKLCNRIWMAKMDDVFRKGAPTIRDLFDNTKSIRCIALNKSSIGKMKKSFDKVEICSLKDFQTMPDFLNELNETEKTEIDELEMSEFFNAINEQEKIEAENAILNVIPFDEFWTENLTEEARIRAIVTSCIWPPNIYGNDEWPTIHLGLSDVTSENFKFCKLSNRVICQLLEIDESQKPSVDEFDDNILPNGENNFRQKIMDKTGLIFEVKKCDCDFEGCNGQIMNIIEL